VRDPVGSPKWIPSSSRKNACTSRPPGPKQECAALCQDPDAEASTRDDRTVRARSPRPSRSSRSAEQALAGAVGGPSKASTRDATVGKELRDHPCVYEAASETGRKTVDRDEEARSRRNGVTFYTAV